MAAEQNPVATVIGVFRGKDGGFEPLTPETPLTPDEVRRNPVFYILDLDPSRGGDNLIIDVIYDNLSPLRLQDLRRGTDIPRSVRFWPDWFDIPLIERCMISTGALCLRGQLGSIRCRSGPPAGRLHSSDGHGTSAQGMTAARARCSGSGSSRGTDLCWKTR